MVGVDFIDIETALLVVNQSVNIPGEPDYAEKSSFSLSSFKKVNGHYLSDPCSYLDNEDCFITEAEV